MGALFALVCVDSGDLLLTHKSAGDGVFSVTVLRVVLIAAGDRAGFLEYRHFDGGSLLSDIAQRAAENVTCQYQRFVVLACLW